MPDSDYEFTLIPGASRPGLRLHRRRLLGLLAFSPFLPIRTPERVGHRSTKTYWFSLIVAGKLEFTDAEVDALFEAGCDDGTPASSCGIDYVHFAREAESFLGAIQSAIRDVQKAGLEVSRVEIEVGDLEGT